MLETNLFLAGSRAISLWRRPDAPTDRSESVDGGRCLIRRFHKEQGSTAFPISVVVARFKADDEIFRAPVGSSVFVSWGTPHCFQSVGDTPVRYPEMFTPTGMERFFEGLAQQPAGEVAPEIYRPIAERASMKVLRPALSVSDQP